MHSKLVWGDPTDISTRCQASEPWRNAEREWPLHHLYLPPPNRTRLPAGFPPSLEISGAKM